MNAILSGSAGVAILVDGKNLFSIDIDQLDEIVPRRPRELPYLLGDAQDQQIVEDVDPETVKRLLDEAWRGTEAIQLALILMDGELSDETRALAATELEEALGTKSTKDQVEAVLWSRPLPPAASIEGALALCERARARTARKMFEQVRARQEPIREMWETFEALPEPLFGDDAGDRARARAGLVPEGAFRELVAAREGGKGAGAAAAVLLLRPGVKEVRNHRAIMAAWTKPTPGGRGDEPTMKSDKKQAAWMYDLRVRARLLHSGALDAKSVERYLAELPDLDAYAETIHFDQPAVSGRP